MRALPTADRFLSLFFAVHGRGSADGRAEQTHADLRLAIELHAPQLLDDDGLVLLAAERQFDPVAAAARVLPAAELPEALDRYLADPVFRPQPRDDARERLATCRALVRAMACDPDITGKARLLRRLDERIRVEAAELRPAARALRRRRVRG